MLFAPIIERELRIAARDWRTYYMRLLAGGAALGAALYLIWMVEGVLGGAGAGAQVLAGLSILSLCLCLYSGVNRTCDCISSEKREDTLGLLFLTHLKGHDIVIGKLVANSMRGLFLLIATLPILSVPVFLGGVTATELVRIPVTLLNSLLLAVAIGILASSVSRSQHTAHWLAGSTMILLAIMLPAASLVVQRFSNFPLLAPYFALLSPSFALQMSFESTFGLRTNLFWVAIAFQFTVAIACIAAACWIVPRTWQVKAGSKVNAAEWRTRIAFGTPEQKLARRRRMLERNPIFWLGSRARLGWVGPVLFAVVSLLGAFYFIKRYNFSGEQGYAVLFVALALNDFVMRTRVASLAAMTLGNARQNGAMEMILSTPLSVHEFVRGLWMSIRHRLLWTYISLLIAFAIFAAKYTQLSFGSVYIMVFFIALSIGDFITIGYVTMWKAIRLDNAQHAAGAAMLRIMVLPWFLWMTIVPLLISANGLRWLFEELGPHAFFVCALVLWAWNSIAAFRSSRRNLFERFREAATDRSTFAQRSGVLGMLRRCSESFPTINLLRARRPPVLN